MKQKQTQKELFNEIKLLQYEHRRLSVFVQNDFDKCIQDGIYTKSTLIRSLKDLSDETKYYKNKIDKLSSKISDMIINKINEL